MQILTINLYATTAVSVYQCELSTLCSFLKELKLFKGYMSVNYVCVC